ncbi:MAG TPA: excisionase family DNA-binding protein [Streptosporangiaceae bacterium]|nr:excisionase family DNA-binding protein [Streptosporangiaceae bacterium]
MTETSTLLDLTGAAERLGITRGKLARNWRQWKIPSVRLGHRTLRFRPADLDAWAAKRARRPVS